MCNKSPPKLDRKYLLCKNRIPLALRVNLCSELARSHVLWSVLLLHKSALSLSAMNSVCSFQFIIHHHQEHGYLCPPAAEMPSGGQSGHWSTLSPVVWDPAPLLMPVARTWRRCGVEELPVVPTAVSQGPTCRVLQGVSGTGAFVELLPCFELRL